VKNKLFGPRVLGAVILTLILLAVGTIQRPAVPAAAQGPGGVTVIHDYRHDVSPPVRSIRP